MVGGGGVRQLIRALSEQSSVPTPAPPLVFASRDGAIVLSAVFGWSNAVIIYKFCVLLGCLFAEPSAGKTRLFLGLFLSVPIGVSRLLAPWVQV